MTREEAARILDPKTMAEERMYYAYYRGFIGDRAWLTAVLEASHMGAKALRKLDEQENNKGCAWCNAEYTIVDDEFVQPVHPKLIKFCWHCGRKLKEESI